MSTHFRLFRPLLVLAVAAAALFSLPGCETVRDATERSYAWVRGELSTVVPGNVERVVRAANRAMEQLRFTRVEERHDALFGYLHTQTADLRDVYVRVEKLSDTHVKVRIRVSTFGDEAISRSVYDRLKDNL